MKNEPEPVKRATEITERSGSQQIRSFCSARLDLSRGNTARYGERFYADVNFCRPLRGLGFDN